ncbi:MAG: InlB B-repeat-containing protein [Bacilli bacterium]
MWKEDIKFNITYDGNNHTSGEVPVDTNTYIVGRTLNFLGHGTLVKTGYKFTGWNTKADGSGVSYKVGQGVVNSLEETRSSRAGVVVNVKLYATWIKDETLNEGNTNGVIAKTGNTLSSSLLLIFIASLCSSIYIIKKNRD